MIQLTQEPIDVAALLAAAQQPAAGAVVLFLGITREFTLSAGAESPRQTQRLAYEAYAPMAQREMQRLVDAANVRWPLVACSVAHRLGEVPLAEASVAIVASSPHRADAFEAGRWLIDELKRDVPIWKREHYVDGSTEWVHPEVAACEAQEPTKPNEATH